MGMFSQSVPYTNEGLPDFKRMAYEIREFTSKYIRQSIQLMNMLNNTDFKFYSSYWGITLNHYHLDIAELISYHLLYGESDLLSFGTESAVIGYERFIAAIDINRIEELLQQAWTEHLLGVKHD